jgi:hypothetical protein
MQQYEDEITETLNEIYTLCGVEYISIGVILIDLAI